MLTKRRLGSTGLQVSPLGLGTVKLGRNQGVKYPQGFELPSDDAAKSLLALARDLGINLIDTAPAYGSSEERLGSLLTNRSDWVIVTKVGEEFINGGSVFDFSEQHIRQSVERSLKRLKTDYLDAVLVHSDGNDVSLIEQGVLESLNRLKQEGKIRASGMSTKTVEGGILAAKHSDIVMATYHLWFQDEKPVLDFCAENGKAVLIKKALASGHMQGESGPHFATTQEAAQASFNFIFSHPGATGVIVGTLSEKHLRENAEAIAQAIS